MVRFGSMKIYREEVFHLKHRNMTLLIQRSREYVCKRPTTMYLAKTALRNTLVTQRPSYRKLGKLLFDGGIRHHALRSDLSLL